MVLRGSTMMKSSVSSIFGSVRLLMIAVMMLALGVGSLGLASNTSEAATSRSGIKKAAVPAKRTVTTRPVTKSVTSASNTATPAASSMSTEQALEILENQSFGYNYAGDPHPQRLARLENLYFGSSASVSTPEKERIKRLAQFIINTNPDTTVAQAPKPATHSAHGGPAAPLTGESRYPTVEAMEKQVFQKTFENEALEPRLARLETRVWGSPQQGALADRSDRLEATIKPFGTSPPAQQASTPEDSYYDASQTGRAPASDAEVAGQLNVIEQRYFNRTFTQEPLDTRLGRVEVMVFQSTAPELTPSDRLYRVVGVLNAQQSARAEAQTGGSYGAPRTPAQVSVPGGYGYGYTTSTGNPYQYQQPSQQPTRRRGMSQGLNTTLQLMFMILSVL